MQLKTTNKSELERKCPNCQQLKMIEDFIISKSGKEVGYSGLCKECSSKYRNKNNERQKKYAPKYRKSIREQVLSAYGNSCICCGETEPQFLAVDHINNDGATHRRELKMNGGGSFYAWIIKNKFPSNLQLLCHNCNLAKAFYGKCPHNK